MVNPTGYLKNKNGNKLYLGAVINNGEIYETGEVLNGKKVYAKRYVTDVLVKGNETCWVPLGLDTSTIDDIWVDMGNSFLISPVKRSLPLVQTYYTDATSNDFFSATIDCETGSILLMSNGGWNTGWKKVITVKFTYV